MNDMMPHVASEVIARVLPGVFPVGCVVINTDDVDPSTVHSFGTWAKIGEVTVSPDGGSTTYTEYHWERTA